MRAPLLLLPIVLAAQTLRVTTSQYDNNRTGADLLEKTLTPRNVNVGQFGKLWSLPLDGDVYAQPLYLEHVDVPGRGIRNLLFIATEHDTVYAFDADSPASPPIWQVTLLSSKDGAEVPVSQIDAECPFISPEIGITSTPVIDIRTGTIYVLARSKLRPGFIGHAEYFQRLHALAITTGHEKFGGPVDIHASVAGSGEGSSNGRVEFNALRENPRASLLLSNGVVYLTWASSCDAGAYHGWVMAYDPNTLRQLAVFNTSPGAGESGIWQADTGPAADHEGNVYVSTGNGIFDAAQPGGENYGDTLLKLHLNGSQLRVAGNFTPYDQAELSSHDDDLGSGGPMLIPDETGNPIGLVFGGKAGSFYSIDPNRMPGLQKTFADPSAQRIPLGSGIYSAPAYWNGHIYYFGSLAPLKSFPVSHGRISSAASSQSVRRSQFSGGTPTVSANGSKDGVVWITETRGWNAGGTHAVLRAYDAADLTRELYSSDQNSARDAAGTALRFTIPTVANGRVYVGTRRSVAVYGLLRR